MMKVIKEPLPTKEELPKETSKTEKVKPEDNKG